MIFSFSTHVMAKNSPILIWVFLIFLNQVVSQNNPNFIYNGFTTTTTTATANISLNGIAKIQTNGILKLTNETSRLLGHAFYPYPIQFKNSTNSSANSFSTSFAFAIVPEYPKLGGHGLAFAIASSKDLPGALPSQYLGLLNASDNGNFSNHVFDIEFDTVQDFEFNDTNDNHIGININSMVSKASVSAAYYTNGNSTKQDLNLKSGSTIFAWIDYDSTKTQITVSISPSNSKPSSPILSLSLDLSPILLDHMYVGFSASTGLLASSHYVFGWSFAINGQSKSLSSIPSLPGPKKSHTTLIISISVSIAAVVSIIAIVLSMYMIRKIKNADIIEAWELDVGPHRFTYPELKKATKGFRDKELLGFGGFGRVYKGTLLNSNTEIAVKQISHESKQGLREFASEITSIGRLRHRNLVQLLGWCRRRKDLLLVYDFMPNGSLDKYLFDKPETILSWGQRFHIIRGVAQGLLYLHEGWEQTVIHRDIKAGNVLLDSELNGRLGDFGLAKLYEHGSNPSTTRVVGTLGYLAPELTRTGKPTTSSDVFAFGALLLEVVCGRRPVEPKASPEELILVDWVWERWRNERLLTVVDGRLRGEYDESEVVVVVKLGLMCSANVAAARPNMRQVVRFLEGEMQLPDILVPPESGGGNRGSGRGVEFEDFVHSFPTSFYEKVSTWSADGDVEGRSGSSFSLSGGGGGGGGGGR